jgi:hypothetical protein
MHKQQSHARSSRRKPAKSSNRLDCFVVLVTLIPARSFLRSTLSTSSPLSQTSFTFCCFVYALSCLSTSFTRIFPCVISLGTLTHGLCSLMDPSGCLLPPSLFLFLVGALRCGSCHGATIKSRWLAWYVSLWATTRSRGRRTTSGRSCERLGITALPPQTPPSHRHPSQHRDRNVAGHPPRSGCVLTFDTTL